MSDCYLPRLGGIEVQVHDLAVQLRAAGHEVEIFTATPPINARSQGRALEIPGAETQHEQPWGEADGLTVHRLSLPLPGGIPINPFAPPQVRRLLRAGGFDVAHVHMGVVSPFAMDLARVSLSENLPTAVTWHCVIDRSAPLMKTAGYAARWARKGAALSAVSSMAAERVGRIVRPGTPVAVLGNGIDVALWRPPAGHRPPQEGPVRIVCAQRMVRRKRPEALLEILRRARALTPSEIALRADIVGDGPQRASMQAWLDAHDMGWVRLPGRVTREQLRTRHWDSHLYLSAARLEAFGIAALEARTAGLAVVVAQGTGTGDFVADGVNGLVGANDDELAEGIAALAVDRERRQRIQAHNAAVPPAQQWSSIVTQTVAEYDRAIAGLQHR